LAPVASGNALKKHEKSACQVFFCTFFAKILAPAKKKLKKMLVKA
jgi:hypothetical protein